MTLGKITERIILIPSGNTSSQKSQTVGDFYDVIGRIGIISSGILTISGNTSSQKSQTVGDFYDVIGRIGIISALKVLSQTSQTSAIFTMSVNLAVLRIAIVVRIPVSGNRKNRGQVGTRLNSYHSYEEGHRPPDSPRKSSGGYDLTSQCLCLAHILSVYVGLIFTECFYVTTFDNNTSKLIEQ